MSKTPTEVEDRICAMYTNGDRPTAIAEQLHVAVKTVFAVVRRRRLPMRHTRILNKFEDWEIQQMKDLYEQGQSYEQIAHAFDVSWETAKRYLQEAGVESRPAGFRTGEDHHAWNGGRTISPDGYVHVRVYEDDPLFCMSAEKVNHANYVLEHRLVMARHLGRPLTDSETVHHKDTNRQNNELSNLQLRQGRHGKGAAFQCADCGSCNIVPVPLASPEAN